MRVSSAFLLLSLVAGFVPGHFAITGNRSRSTRRSGVAAEGLDINHRRARADKGDKPEKKKNHGRENPPAKDKGHAKISRKPGHQSTNADPIVMDIAAVAIVQSPADVQKGPGKKKIKKGAGGSGRGDESVQVVKKVHKKDEARRPVPTTVNDVDDKGERGNLRGKPARVRNNDPYPYYPVTVTPCDSTIVQYPPGTGFTPAPAPNALSCNQERCGSRPSSMTLFFSGNSCGTSFNSQNEKIYFDSLIQESLVYVYVTEATNQGNVFFSGRVAKGGDILIDNDSPLPSKLMITVYDVDVRNELQQFSICSDCVSGNLYIGDTFCGVMVRSITTPFDGIFGTCTAVYVPPGQSAPGKSGKSGKLSGKASKNLKDIPQPVIENPNPIPPGASTLLVPFLPAPVQAVYPGECDDPAIMVRMQLTGGGCEASKTLNDQGQDFICVIDANEAMQSVRVQITAPGDDMIFNGVVAYQDVIEISYPPDVLPDMLTVHILTLDELDLQLFSYNPSCKKPLAIGDVLGAFTIVGFETPQQGLVTGGMNKPTLLPPVAPSTTPLPPTPISMPVSMPVQEQDCKGSQCVAMPTQIKIIFTGSACKSGSNSQETATCTDNGMITFPASLTIMENNVLIFSGLVPNKDSQLTVGTGVDPIPVDMSIMIRDSSAQGTILQSVTFKTDCLTPLFIGDEFGALKLVEFTNSEGTAGGCMTS